MTDKEILEHIIMEKVSSDGSLCGDFHCDRCPIRPGIPVGECTYPRAKEEAKKMLLDILILEALVEKGEEG